MKIKEILFLITISNWSPGIPCMSYLAYLVYTDDIGLLFSITYSVAFGSLVCH